MYYVSTFRSVLFNFLSSNPGFPYWRPALDLGSLTIFGFRAWGLGLRVKYRLRFKFRFKASRLEFLGLRVLGPSFERSELSFKGERGSECRQHDRDDLGLLQGTVKYPRASSLRIGGPLKFLSLS